MLCHKVRLCTHIDKHQISKRQSCHRFDNNRCAWDDDRVVAPFYIDADRFSVFMLVYRDQDITQNPNLPNHPIIKPNNPTNPEDPDQPSKPIDPSKPADPKPEQPIKPVKPIQPNQPIVSNQNQTVKPGVGLTPNTGDNTNALAWLMLCVCGSAIMIISKKRSNQA